MLTKNAAKLDRIQDEVYADPSLQPKNGVTFCNIAVDRVATAYGCDGLHDAVTKEPFVADVMHWVLSTSKDFLVKPMADCQELVNSGALVFAAMTSARLGEAHGHIVTLTPGKEDYSGVWDCKVPLCMNVGTTNFRSKGINWAFPVEKGVPELYTWSPSL